MPYWILNLSLVFTILLTAWSIWLSIRFQWGSKSNLIIDWGPIPKRVHDWVFVVVVAYAAWHFWKSTVPNQLLSRSLAIMNWLIAVRVALNTFRHLGIYKEGILVLMPTLWTTTETFIRWCDIKTYRWEEQGRLVINSSWGPTICQISEERIADLDAVLKEKCLDAELIVPLEKR